MHNNPMVMVNPLPSPTDADALKFVERDMPDTSAPTQAAWRLLVVDDEPDVHHVTTFALNRVTILGRPLEFLHAYSAAQAAEILQREQDIAVVLLDVVMEREHAGLELVKVIRQELKLTELRIILRTGQAGYAPEIEAIHDYDINDYKTKSELTRTKLFASVTSAIRAFEQIRALNALAFYDQLTGLANRNRFIDLIDGHLRKNTVGDMMIAILDIDDFSEINDALGHQHGDRLLQSVAERLLAHLGAGTVVARLGSDTFGLMGTSQALEPLHLLGLFREPFVVMEDAMVVSATMGLVGLMDVESNGKNFLKDANIALKLAKKNRRGSHIVFSSEMGAEIRERVRLLRGLRAAVERERLFVVYQPQLNLDNHRVVGMEALVRWRDADGNFIAPDRFIPLAETSGLIVVIGDWVMRMACHELVRLQSRGWPDLRVSVNVSQIQFRDPNFLDRLKKALVDTGVNPRCLELEITESIAMEDVDFVLKTLYQIKALGITVAIDDFGTGYSCLSHLRQLPADRLKIDRAFVRELTQEVQGGHIAAMVVELGRNLKLTVIAEGVEEEYQAVILRKMGCHEGQGYLYAQPMPPSQLEEWLGAHKLHYPDHVPASPIQAQGPNGSL